MPGVSGILSRTMGRLVVLGLLAGGAGQQTQDNQVCNVACNIMADAPRFPHRLRIFPVLGYPLGGKTKLASA
jgi:hypothetical protein